MPSRLKKDFNSLAFHKAILYKKSRQEEALILTSLLDNSKFDDYTFKKMQ